MGVQMAQEENISGGGGGGGGGGGAEGGCGGGCTRSKKIKQKKVPQRGLGVAQLEKIRLEEQEKRESLQAANILAKNAVGCSSSANSNHHSFLAVQKSIRLQGGVPPFHNSVVPLPPPLPPSDLSIPYRHSQSLPNLEIMQESYLVSRQSNAGGVVELDSRVGVGQGRLWGGGEMNLARDNLGLDHHGFSFDPLSYENTHFSNVSQRSHQFQHHPPPPPSPSSSMLQVNSSSGISPSSVASSQMEPPSNQSFRGNSYANLWTEEDKMVGVKRSYPFSLDSPPTTSLHRSFHPIYVASSSKSDEPTQCNNGYTDQMVPRNKCIRLGSSPLPETKPNEVALGDGKLNGDILTLAPPSIVSPPLTMKQEHTLGYAGHQGHEYERTPIQEYNQGQTHQPRSSISVEKTFSFFPTKLQMNKTTNEESTGHGGKGETIDLNLKL